MKRDREPTRLTEMLDDGGESLGLRRALTDARRTGPDVSGRARIAAGVAAAIAGAGSANAQPRQPGRQGNLGTSFGPLALTAGLAGLAAVSLIVTLSVRGGPSRAPAGAPEVRPAAAPARSVTTTVAPPLPGPAPARAAVVLPGAAAPELARQPARPLLPRHLAPRASAAPSSSAAAMTRRPGVPTEGELLRRAQEALRDAPERALALVETHASTYPAGALAQERDVIAIEALTRLGRRDQARTAAQRFLQQHPDSPHRGHVEALLGRASQ